MLQAEKKAVEYKFAVYSAFFLLFLFVHLFLLDKVPYGIHIDEAGMAYDAYCLANFSVDRYLKHLPVYLINYGGGQSALYAYLTAFFIWLTGDVSIWIMRLPAAIISVLAYLAGISLVKTWLGEKWGMAAAFLLAVFPYFIMQSRFGLDCNLQLGMTTIGLWLLQKAVCRKRYLWFLIAGCVWGLAFYTYALSYISITVFLAGTLIYLMSFKKITWRSAAIFCVPVFFMGLPLAIMVMRNKAGMPQLDLGPFTIPRLDSFRGSEVVLSKLSENLFLTLKVVFTKDWLEYNAFDIYGTLYPISIPFGLIGIFTMPLECVWSIRKKCFSIWCIVETLFCSNLLVSMILGGDGPNINKANGIFFSLFLMVLFGIRKSYIFIKRRWGNLAQILILFLFLFYGISFLFFSRYYFFQYPTEIYPQYLFDDTYEELLTFMDENLTEEKPVYVDSTYIYHYLSARLDPHLSNVGENGPMAYENFVFSLPEALGDDAYYIVKETNENYIRLLKAASFLSWQGDGQFILFYKN